MYKDKKVRAIAKRSLYQRIRRAILAILGEKCVKCGFSDIRALQVDHVKGGGTARRRESGLGETYRILRELTEGTDNNQYQLLCANCNWIKRVENKEHN